MILFGTGHRPDKLAPGNKRLAYSAYCFQRQVDCAAKMLGIHKPKLVISGMALGWDQALAQAAIDLQIPFAAYIPCIGQECKWPYKTQKFYQEQLKKACEINYITKTTYAENPYCMQQRNIAMVDASNFCLALWDGSPGGTGNCMEVVMERKMKVKNVWKEWLLERAK